MRVRLDIMADWVWGFRSSGTWSNCTAAPSSALKARVKDWGDVLAVAADCPDLSAGRRDAEGRAGSEPAPFIRLTGVRVLVVDDQPDALDLVRCVLEQSEAVVCTAASCEEALARIAAGPLDVLISDLSMPGEDGFSLIRKLRKLPADAGGIYRPALMRSPAASSENSRCWPDIRCF